MTVDYPVRKRVPWQSVALVGFTFLLVGCSAEQKPAPKPYTLPADLSLDPHAERGTEGEIYVGGSTNFPNDTKLWISIESGRLPLGAPNVIASDDDVRVSNGKIRTVAMWQRVPDPAFPSVDEEPKFLKRPFQAGSYKVRFEAYFNSAWQSPGVLVLLGGEGGKNLHGKILKLQDPDVIDSSKVLDDLTTIALPPLKPEAIAISLVKAVVLTVPGMGRSATDVETNISLFMSAPAFCRPARGWSAHTSDADMFEVVFDFIDGGAGEKQAIWSVDLKTGKVKYVNESAKIFSWTPNY